MSVENSSTSPPPPPQVKFTPAQGCCGVARVPATLFDLCLIMDLCTAGLTCMPRWGSRARAAVVVLRGAVFHAAPLWVHHAYAQCCFGAMGHVAHT